MNHGVYTVIGTLSIFLQEHGVEPYHLASLASYKFNFIVRNKRIDQSWKIYKFYSLYALGVQACKGKQLFDLTKKEFREACERINKIITDEAKFVDHVTTTANLIDLLLSSRNLETREQVRDMLRSESFGSDFKTKYKKSTGIS